MYIIYFLLPIILFTFIILFIFFFRMRKRNIPAALFSEALKNENNGHFEAAVINYENALSEEKKSRFQNNTLKAKIIEKLKVLHTNIEYKNSLHNTGDRYAGTKFTSKNSVYK